MNVKQLLIYVVPPIFLVPFVLFFFVWSINSTAQPSHIAEEQKALFEQQKDFYNPQAFIKKEEIINKIENLNIQFTRSQKVLSIKTDMLEDTIINKFKILAMLDRHSVKYSNIHIELFGQLGLVKQYFKASHYDVAKMQKLSQRMSAMLNNAMHA